MKGTTENIISIMSEKYQIDISVYDDSFLEKSIRSRMNELSVKRVTDYEILINDNPSESLLLKDSLNNSYSEFFRNPLTFLMLEQVIIPKILNEKSESKSNEIRIWSAGCAAGQEAYSLAILAENCKHINNHQLTLRIFATDIDENELQTARKGIYHFRSMQNSRLGLVNNYFSNSGEYYSINNNIKEIVEFSVFDLIDGDEGAPPSSIYGDFDIVMCSNLLFYYNPVMQKKILKRLYNSIVEGGFLVTGEAEVAIIKTVRGFKQYAAPAAVFTKAG
jgi:chemotaxis protein methyltransferase CheR